MSEKEKVSDRKIYKAQEIAEYFIDIASSKVIGDKNEKEGITHLKLQKILYFAQAYYLGTFGRELFSDKIEAWAYGPVIPTVYNKYTKYRSEIIPIAENSQSFKTSIDDEDKETLKTIWNSYGKYSAGYLVDISHEHDPWKKAQRNWEDKEITKDQIKKYYSV